MSGFFYAQRSDDTPPRSNVCSDKSQLGNLTV